MATGTAGTVVLKLDGNSEIGDLLKAINSHNPIFSLQKDLFSRATCSELPWVELLCYLIFNTS